MRISFISPPVGLEGGNRVMVMYARCLKRMGHTVRIVSPPPQKLAIKERFTSWLEGSGWPDIRASRKSHLDGIDIDHHVIDRDRPIVDDDVPDGDVVIATWWETAEWVAALSAPKGAKVYFIQHHEIHNYLPQARTRATYRLPFHKIVVARWLKQVMMAQYGDVTVDLVPNSVDMEQFFAPVRGKRPIPSIGFMFAGAHFKGLDTTLSALTILRKKFESMRIISFGTERPNRSLVLPEGAEFFRSPPQHELRTLYARCDVWATASRSEGFNLPALEAMACRTPVVSTRTGWPEEAIKSGWNGVLVDFDDAQGLADGLEWMISRSDGEWRELSANAYATAASGSWDASAELFERALEHACRRAASGEIAGNGLRPACR
jgi:glycosyltransferase involved in cell wall biosynthesis